MTALPNATLTGGYSTPRAFVHQLDQRDPWLTRTGAVLLLMLIPSYLASLVDPRVFEGVNVWVKPMKFQLSVGLYLLTVAWFMAYTRPEFQTRRRRKWMSGILMTAALFEVLYITLQGSLAQASHFNESDALHGFLYTLMGVGALMLALMVGWQGLEVARHRQSPLRPALQSAIAWGLILTSAFTLIAGFTISAFNGPIIGLSRSEITGTWLFGWATNGGDLRVAHFLGTHAMHIIPAMVWLIGRSHVNRTAFWMGCVLFLFTILWVYTYLRALSGLPVWLVL